MKRDFLFLGLFISAATVVALDLAYIIYVVVSIAVFASGRGFTSPAFWIFSIVAAVMNILLLSYASIYAAMKSAFSK
jgi:hypothetical protein